MQLGVQKIPGVSNRGIFVTDQCSKNPTLVYGANYNYNECLFFIRHVHHLII